MTSATPTSATPAHLRPLTPTRRGAAKPSRLLLLTEPWRSAVELSALPAATPFLRRAPHGDGHPVLVIPGFLGGDGSTLLLRRFLRRLEYDAVGWGLGVNIGPTDTVREQLPARLEELATRSGGPVSIIGWSMGGIYARALSSRSPHSVRQVITLGSPYAAAGPGASHADAAYLALARRRTAAVRARSAGAAQRAVAVSPVPSTSVYSHLDGIVSWRACREQDGDRRESIALACSHLGFGHHPAALWVIADRLAQEPGQWRPFVPSGRFAAWMVRTGRPVLQHH